MKLRGGDTLRVSPPLNFIARLSSAQNFMAIESRYRNILSVLTRNYRDVFAKIRKSTGERHCLIGDEIDRRRLAERVSSDQFHSQNQQRQGKLWDEEIQADFLKIPLRHYAFSELNTLDCLRDLLFSHHLISNPTPLAQIFSARSLSQDRAIAKITDLKCELHNFLKKKYGRSLSGKFLG